MASHEKRLTSRDAARVRKIINKEYNLKLGDYVEIGGIRGEFVALQAHKYFQTSNPCVDVILYPSDLFGRAPKIMESEILYEGYRIPLRPILGKGVKGIGSVP